jgi:hypothetical protein
VDTAEPSDISGNAVRTKMGIPASNDLSSEIAESGTINDMGVQ